MLDLRRLAARPDRQQGQQGHAGQVLKDQHGDGTAAVAGGELALVGQLSADQRRGRHGRRSAEQHCPAGEPEVSEGEFQSDHEQQQRHAQLGQKAQRLPGAITPMTEGPSTTPTERYPSKAGTLNAAVAIAARLQAASRINVAPSKPCIGQRPTCVDVQRTMSCVPIAPA